MLYLSGHVGPALCGRPDIGFMLTQDTGYRVPEGAQWAADSATWAHPFDFDLDRYLDWLDRKTGDERRRCLFVTCPDVPGDAELTRANISVLADIRQLGYPTAYVHQPGEDLDALPWQLIDCLFLGGPEWHHQEQAAATVAAAHARGKWAHRGRVNRRARLRSTYTLGFDSADGTLAAFGPRVNIPKLLRTMDELAASRTLF